MVDGMLFGPVTAARWADSHLAAHQARHDELHATDPAAPGAQWLSAADVLGPGFLAGEHARIVAAEGASPAGAAKTLASWYAGAVGGLVGFTWATARAGLLVGLPGLRWRRLASGWPDRVDLGRCPMVVADGHPWSGQPGVRTVPDDAAAVELAMTTLTEAVTPVLSAVRRLAKVGATALWAEVGDAVGLPVLHHPTLPVDDAVVTRLHAALHTPGAPWRQTPDLRVGTAAHGPVYLGRKAGCCLAYQSSPRDGVEDEPDWCSTCSLRDLAGCEELQRRWHADHRP